MLELLFTPAITESANVAEMPGAIGVALQVSLEGLLRWGTGFISDMAIFAIVALALNMQWGYGGVFNVGVVAFFMVGAYISALFTLGPPGETSAYVGGFGLAVPIGWIAGAFGAAILGLLVGLPALRLQRDFLAIMTIGLATIFRSIANTVDGLVNRSAGLHAIPRLFGDPEGLIYVSGDNYRWLLLAINLVALMVIYLLVRAITQSPWGRTLRATRDSEHTAAASGKNLFVFRTQALVVGGALMGFAGALWGHSVRAFSPAAFTDLFGTFLIWIMVMAGGSGNNKGTLLGAFVIGFFWFGVALFQSLIPDNLQEYIPQARQFITGLLVVLVLLYKPRGIIPERSKVSRFIPIPSRIKLN